MRLLGLTHTSVVVAVLASAATCQTQDGIAGLKSASHARDEFKMPNTGHCQDRSNYVLGPNDQVTVLMPDLEELNGKQFRVDNDGQLQLPLAGRVDAAGLNAEQLTREIEDHLKNFVKKPEAVVTVTDFRSQPVSVLGLVGIPGVYQVQGCKTLFEVLSMAGGLKPEAGDRIRVTREIRWGSIPLAQAHNDASGRFSVASVRVKSIMDANHPEENIAILPNDVISVPRAEMIFVVGAVHKPGGFLLGEEESLSVLQVISLAEGPDKTAATNRAKVMRPIPGTTQRQEIPVDLGRLMAGKKANDLRLRANDILFVPDSAGKSFGAKALDAAINAMTGAAVYRPF